MNQVPSTSWASVVVRAATVLGAAVCLWMNWVLVFPFWVGAGLWVNAVVLYRFGPPPPFPWFVRDPLLRREVGTAEDNTGRPWLRMVFAVFTGGVAIALGIAFALHHR